MKSSSQPPVRLGVDFAWDEIRIVAMRPMGDQRAEVSLLDRITLNAHADREGMFTDANAVVGHLQPWVKRNRLEGSPCVFSVPNESAYFAWAEELPEGSDGVTAGRYMLKRQHPRMSGDAYVTIARPNATGAAVVLGAERGPLAQRANLLERAGLVPVGAETEAQAILRIIQRHLNRGSGAHPHRTSLFGYVGRGRTNLLVVQRGRLSYLRSARVGTGKIEETVARALDITPDEAASVLFSPRSRIIRGSHVLIDGDLACQVDISEPLGVFAKEFRRLMAYLRSLHPDQSHLGMVDVVVLMGRINGLRGFDQALADQLHVQMETVDPTIGLTLALPESAFARYREHGSQYAVAVGLATAPYHPQAAVYLEESNHENATHRAA